MFFPGRGWQISEKGGTRVRNTKIIGLAPRCRMVVQENRDMMISGFTKIASELDDAVKIVFTFLIFWSIC